MKIIKPKRLHHRDVIGICAPASPPASESKLNKGILYLERLGFRVEVAKNVLRRYGYLAGTDKQRAEDLCSLFKNPKVKAIFTIRGGYGSHRILPLLDYDLIKQNPKILVGYSDITALQLAILSKVGLVTFSGPMVGVNMGTDFPVGIEERFWNLLFSTALPPKIKGRKRLIFKKGFSIGRLIGGNLSIISSIVGTPFFPKINNPVFLLEEFNEQPYRIDRMLQQMKLANAFNKAKGVGLGDFTSCKPEKEKPSLKLKKIFQETFSDFSFPIISDIPYGHFRNSVPFPIGVLVKLCGQENQLDFLESGVC